MNDKDALVREFLQYDPSSPTGLRWAKAPGRTIKAGQPALTAKSGHGYCRGSLRGHTLSAHRTVFFLEHGHWPEEVDHINGVRDDNRVENLRAVTKSQNKHNRVEVGIWHHKARGKYIARIAVEGKRHFLGSFGTEQEARQAYLDAKRVYHPTAPERCYGGNHD